MSPRSLLFVTAALLGACISTTPFDVYMPQGGGELVKSRCPSGPPRVLRIVLPDQVQLLIESTPADVYPTPYLQIALYVRLLVPVGNTVRLTGADVVLTSTAWSAPRPAKIVQIVDLDASSVWFPPLAELAGKQGTPKYLGYQLAFTDHGPRSATSVPAVDGFTLQLPAIVVNGREVSIEQITFAKQAIGGLNYSCA